MWKVILGSVTVAATGMAMYSWLTCPDARDPLIDVTLYAPAAPVSQYKIKDAHSITFRIPKTYIGGSFGNRKSARGEQIITFSYWSKSLDPYMPDLIATKERCETWKGNFPVNRDPCPESLLERPRAAGEKLQDLEMSNAVNTAEEIEFYALANLVQARESKEHCEIQEIPEIKLIAVSLPKADWPFDLETARNTDIPPLCPTRARPGGIIGGGGQIMRDRQSDNSYKARFEPRVYYFHVGTKAGESYSATARGSMGLHFGSWHGALLTGSMEPSEWVEAHDTAINFLKKYVLSRTID